MEYNIQMQNYEGPFDLLLELLQKDKINICDISIVEITNQFSMFFGAGNLIFPPMLGANAGDNFVPAVTGFLISEMEIGRAHV